jgi:hypothetical protein
VDAVQMRSRLGQNEELGPIGIRALVGHGQQEWSGEKYNKIYYIGILMNTGSFAQCCGSGIKHPGSGMFYPESGS